MLELKLTENMKISQVQLLLLAIILIGFLAILREINSENEFSRDEIVHDLRIHEPACQALLNVN